MSEMVLFKNYVLWYDRYLILNYIYNIVLFNNNNNNNKFFIKESSMHHMSILQRK